MKRSYQDLKLVVEDSGFEFFEGHYNFNFIGVRSNKEISNTWDDNFYVAYQKREKDPKTGETILASHVLHIKDFTTDPGEYYSQHKLLNEKGVAILARGQHRGMWKLGMHRGKYKAFVQRGKCVVFRDGNRDKVQDYDVEDRGLFGINMHHGYGSDQVGRNSAGCQVFKKIEDLQKVIDLFNRGKQYNGPSVSYTLLNKSDFDNMKNLKLSAKADNA